jgi:SAM-dependent methyltransferase
MIGLPDLTLRRVLNGARVLIQGRPKCLKLVRSLVSDKKGIEIGGLSAVFRQIYNLPIYNNVLSLDNCDFSQNTTWASHTSEYCFSKRKACGRSYFCEGSNLSEIQDDQYDFLLSSHNLEHMANPIKGLKEWQRIVKPGGHLVIVLPHYARTFDRQRVPTTIQHMIKDYELNTGEDDTTHVDEICAAQCLDDRLRSNEDLRTILLNNFSHRMMHHHVFNESNSKGLLEAVGLKVLAVETQLPFHIFLVAQTPLL